MGYSSCLGLHAGCICVCQRISTNPWTLIGAVVLRVAPQAASEVDTATQQQSLSGLLELPKPALQLVLGQLDQCSLVCTAVTCSTLRHVLASHLSNATITQPEGGHTAWLEQHRSSIAQVTQCSFLGQYASCPGSRIHNLPCPRLRQLYILDVDVQLGPVDMDSPGVLHDCTGLTRLSMRGCSISGVPAAAAALAALPELRSLSLGENVAAGDVCLLAELQELTLLTCLVVTSYCVKPESLGQL